MKVNDFRWLYAMLIYIDVTKLFDTTMKLLQQAVKDNSEPSELEAALTAAKLTPVQVDTFGRFWKVQRGKVLGPLETASLIHLSSFMSGHGSGLLLTLYYHNCSGG